ncbi:hypothetical protein ACQY0O_007296 [Thecaphora frezii]
MPKGDSSSSSLGGFSLAPTLAAGHYPYLHHPRSASFSTPQTLLELCTSIPPPYPLQLTAGRLLAPSLLRPASAPPLQKHVGRNPPAIALSIATFQGFGKSV